MVDLDECEWDLTVSSSIFRARLVSILVLSSKQAQFFDPRLMTLLPGQALHRSLQLYTLVIVAASQRAKRTPSIANWPHMSQGMDLSCCGPVAQAR